MTTLDIVLLVTLLAAFGVLVSPRMRRSRGWDATVTPLASIIGSGFLVSVPLMASAVGLWAIPAVATLTGLAYLIGGAIRYNIRHAEPILAAAKPGHALKSIETASHIVLVGAYFISVPYYLVLLSAFGMKLLGVADPVIGKLAASAIVSGICLVGAWRGLQGVERAETFTVSANLAAITALLVALGLFGTHLPPGFSWGTALAAPHQVNWNTLRFLIGLLIIVQGFETTRFMGQLYDAETRIAAMRRSQIASTLIYLAFFALTVPLYPLFTSSTDVAAFIDVVGHVSPWLPFVVAGGAIASQFSAAVADSIGGSGLIAETARRHVTTCHAYVLIGAVGLLVIWGTDVVSLVALASRAFALFYAMQCTVALVVARGRKDLPRAFLFATLAGLAFAVALLGIPAGG
jgi:hypothetical protein